MEMTYHIYFKKELLFKNLNEEEFEFIWERIYKEYHTEDLSYAVCVGAGCVHVKEPSF
tara:strand:- start:362 stop:535 length:174 start_codon:yes stop_codon:yes gene_type:complete